jgi:cobyrinic acid a,c-diamide synthase
MNHPSKQAKGFLIAAPKSNSGKTIITLGLIKALKNMGLKVQPFKCGPDYIDTRYHTMVAEKPSYNLDTWMSTPNHVKNLFGKLSNNADISVVEGVMGLFDGAIKAEGSSAALAKLLNLPVILIVDASSMAYSMAPLLFGFKNFDKKIKLAGVIFNKVNSEFHYAFLKDAARDAGVNVLGYIPKNEKLIFKSRHLGLFQPEEQDISSIDTAAALIEKHLNLDDLINNCTINFKSQAIPNIKTTVKKIHIAVARDEAFNFTYQANIDRLSEIGKISFFSPIHNKNLPKCDLVWLPGGYPELYASQLSENINLISQIKEHVNNKLPIIAECGGMMYLGKSLTDKSGQKHTMAGVIDVETSLQNMALHLGYRVIKYQGKEWKGHEFHFSEITKSNEILFEGSAQTARSEIADLKIFFNGKIWASYMHLYLGEPQKMKSFLRMFGI